MRLRLDTSSELSVLERLPGAQRLQADELPFAGCSALVAVDEVSELAALAAPSAGICRRHCPRRNACSPAV